MLADPILLLVDFQRGFCDPALNPVLESDLAIERMHEVRARTSTILNRYREADHAPVFVRTHHSPGRTRRSTDPSSSDAPPLCLPGTEAAEFIDELDIQDDDFVVTKLGYDPFHETDLDALLSTADGSHVLVCGVVTNICVTATAFGLKSRGYEVTVLEDCIAASSTESHEHGLHTLEAVADAVHSSSEVGLISGCGE
ncbi:cysteine hydrolase family protein [Halobellus rufus]|uniref:cysteine hydrolase family protein n=1 Tax=Halobellus rufus TaxID=1448860 RepID=UPI0009DE91FC|nr:isochorismatase family cysteine hydrolase [Halobellus rufus]